MKISLINAGKRFNRDWIFRNLHYEFITGGSCAITGPNGSGKSTLLQVIAGSTVLSEGNLNYETGKAQDSGYKLQVTSNTGQGSSAPPAVTSNLQPRLTGSAGQAVTDNFFQYISMAAPYLEVVEEMTVLEFLSFHKQFKPFLQGFDSKKIIAIVGLEKAAHKQIRYYSSGMKQRVRLAQAIFSDVPCVLLDEPCTNLDAEGIALYHQLMNDYCKKRLIIVSSNEEQEYGFCKERINILDWKK